MENSIFTCEHFPPEEILKLKEMYTYDGADDES